MQNDTGYEEEPGVKHDSEKERMDLIPPLAIQQVAHVLTFGARKYDDDNWRKIKDLRKRYIAAALRHIRNYQECQRYGGRGVVAVDSDSDLPALAHAVTCLMFIIEADEAGIDLSPQGEENVGLGDCSPA